MANIDELTNKLNDIIRSAKDKSISSEKTPAPKTVAKNGKNYVPNGKKFGRNGGRPTKEATLIKKGLKQALDELFTGEDMIEIEDPKTGLKRKVAKSRALWAAEMLYKYGMTMASKMDYSGIQALNMFLDRAIGKPAQPIRGEGEGDAPIKLHVDNLPELLAKVYGNDK